MQGVLRQYLLLYDFSISASCSEGKKEKLINSARISTMYLVVQKQSALSNPKGS